MQAMCGASPKQGASSRATVQTLAPALRLVTAGFGIKTLIWCSTQSEFL